MTEFAAGEEGGREGCGWCRNLQALEWTVSRLEKAVAQLTSLRECRGDEGKRCAELETKALYYKGLSEGVMSPAEARGYENGWIVGKLCRVHVIDPWQGDKVIEVDAFWGGARHWFSLDGGKFHAKYVRVLS